MRADVVPAFPLLKAVAEAYRDVGSNVGPLLRIAGLWILAPVGLAALGRLIVEPPLPSGPGAPIVIPLEALLLAVLGWAIWLVGLNAVVVAWLRRLLLDEWPAMPLAPVSARVLRYVLMTLGVGIAVAVPVMLLTFVLATLLAGPGGQVSTFLWPPLLHLIIGVLGAVVMARTHLVFPAIAIGDASMSIGRSWRLTSTYTLPVVIGLILSAVPVMLAGSILQSLLIAVGGPGSLLGLATVTATYFAQGAVVAAFLALSYRFFTTRVAAPGGPD